MGTIFKEMQSTFMRLAGISELTVQKDKSGIPQNAVSIAIRGVDIYIPMEELIDFEKEMERLQKEKEDLEKELARVNGKLGNKSFVEKAPAAVVEAEKEKREKYNELYNKVLERISFVENL